MDGADDERKTVVLHVGLPKTATSAIQRFASENRELLLEFGVHYLRSGQNPVYHDSGHHMLPLSLLEERWHEMEPKVDPAALQPVWQNLRSEIDNRPERMFFASSEMFAMDVVQIERIQRVRDELPDCHVKIVVVLRDVVDFLNSVYSARVFHGFDGTIEDYIWLAWPHLNWSALVAPWQSVFGRENVLILSFDAVPREDFIPYFFRNVAGIPEDRVAEIGVTKVNFTLNKASVEFIRTINADLGPDSGKLREDVLSAIGRHMFYGGERAKFINDQWSNILRRYCEWPQEF